MAEKMNANEKKVELLNTLGLFLTGDMTGVDQNLIDRVKYTVENAKPAKVSLKTLTDLMDEVSTAIRNAVQTAQATKSSKTKKGKKEPQPMEALKKPSASKPKVSSKKKEEEPEETPAPAKEEKVAKKPEPKTSKKVSKYNMDSCFPNTIEDEELGTLVKVPDKFHDYGELKEFLEEGGELYFATYWTSRLIKEYDYSRTWEVPCPSSFPHNLDLLVALLTCENTERVWCMSRYTEAMMNFDGKSLVPVEDYDPRSGDKCKIRVMNGMEFELYMKEDAE